MSNLKLIALLLVSFVATGSVVYQIRSRRPKTPIVAQPPRGSTPLPANAVSVTPEQADAQSISPGATALPVDTPTNIPAASWGRNPFMTRDEIDQLNKLPPPQVVEVPAPAQPTTPAGPPTYAVTAIIYGPNGSFAVVNSRVIQPGDRIGYETVKEIKSGVVVLEYEGRTRELPLRRSGPEIQIAVPKGD